MRFSYSLCICPISSLGHTAPSGWRGRYVYFSRTSSSAQLFLHETEKTSRVLSFHIKLIKSNRYLKELWTLSAMSEAPSTAYLILLNGSIVYQSNIIMHIKIKERPCRILRITQGLISISHTILTVKQQNLVSRHTWSLSKLMLCRSVPKEKLTTFASCLCHDKIIKTVVLGNKTHTIINSVFRWTLNSSYREVHNIAS